MSDPPTLATLYNYGKLNVYFYIVDSKICLEMDTKQQSLNIDILQNMFSDSAHK